MSYEEKLDEVKREVVLAIELIGKKYAGANLREARIILGEAAEAIRKDDLDGALELAKKAQLAAKPTTEYLLSKAKELAGGAQNNYQSKRYEEAMDLWNKALEEYGRAEELARERNEKEIFEKVIEGKKKIKENISKAEIALDHQKMHGFVENGNKLVEEANRLFEDKKFDESKDVYEEAKKAFKNALNLADKRNFLDDKIKIEEALKSVEESIEGALLSKGDEMLRKAEESYNEKKYDKSVEGYSSALEYLKSLKIQKKEFEELTVRGREGLIKAKFEMGKEKMREAENLFNSGKYYDAKEAYKATRAYFEGVAEEATNFKLIKILKEEINPMVEACTQNINAATTALTEVAAVEAPIFIPVDRVVKGRGVLPIQGPRPIAPTVEKLLHKYKELVYLGGGGFADVYKGIKWDGSVVAVKVPRNLDEKNQRIFFRELSTWEKLRHRNIVRYIEPFVKPEPHIEIEYIDGVSLYNVLQTKSLDVEKACRIAFDIASGLEYAHNRHIIHGDINPKNVLLTSSGEAKITDFGLAKIVSSSTQVKGYTLLYAPVEVLEKLIADEKSDVYQLGLTTYVMLTGCNPFEADSKYEIEEKIKNLTPEPPSKYNPVCSDLDDLIMRCLSKKPADRPSLREFRESIYEFIKKRYNVSLPLTEDIDKILAITCNYALMAAKQGDIGECLRALNSAKEKIRDPEIRNEMKKLIENVEYRAKNEITLEQLLDKMEIFLKKVQWKG